MHNWKSAAALNAEDTNNDTWVTQKDCFEKGEGKGLKEEIVRDDKMLRKRYKMYW